MTIPPVQRQDNNRRVTSPGMVDTTTADTAGHALLKLVLLITEVASVQVLVFIRVGYRNLTFKFGHSRVNKN